MKIAGICGSLRKGSYNSYLLKAAEELLPEGLSLTVAPIEGLPFYDADLDIPLAKDRPATVNAFRRILEEADGILIVSPEYNYSIPGGLKNAIDWASRGTDSPLIDKPVALMGATPGLLGTVRMQLAFLPVFQFLNMQVVHKPEVLIAQANTKFDENGNLLDAKAKELVSRKLENLKTLIINNQK